jgi:hypothetical protein
MDSPLSDQAADRGQRLAFVDPFVELEGTGSVEPEDRVGASGLSPHVRVDHQMPVITGQGVVQRRVMQANCATGESE